MNQEIINIWNPKIAVFMGLQLNKEGNQAIFITNAFGTGTKTVHPLEYHKEWNWIMPVVEKICKLTGEGFLIDEVSINKKSCVIKALPVPYTKGSSFIAFYREGDIINDKPISKIETVYLAVTEFLQWLEENKK